MAASHSVVPKIKFTPQDDAKLTEIVGRLGSGNWELVAKEMKTKNARQCRERWINYISPELRNDPWTKEDDQMLDELYQEFGSRWHKIAEFFPTRSGNSVRNRYKLRQRREQRQKIRNKMIKQEKKDLKLKPKIDKIPAIDDQIRDYLVSMPQEEIFNMFNTCNDANEHLVMDFL